LESKWCEETMGKQSRTKRHKSNLEDKDVDPLPDLPCKPAEMVFFGDEDYQPDCPWKNTGIEGAINDALDEWDCTDSNTEGSLQMNWVSLEGNKTRTRDDLFEGTMQGRNDTVSVFIKCVINKNNTLRNEHKLLFGNLVVRDLFTLRRKHANRMICC
jgi:hypothetical protein